MYLHRRLTSTLIQAAKQFPVVFLTGPRQSGKTTLLRNIFPDFKYLCRTGYTESCEHWQS